MYFGPTQHHLRISLNDVEPEIWRTVVVDSDILLPHLATVFASTMGWEGYHLHQFVVGDISFAPYDPDMSQFTIPHEQITLEQIAQEGSEFEWEYDFGDGWSHRVVVQQMGEPQQANPPVCLDGANACPPEDCGGPGGYAHLLEVLADPEHDEHDLLMEWVGGGFEPEAFDRKVVDERLRFLRQKRPR